MKPFPDTSQTLKNKILKCIDDYGKYGIFCQPNGNPRFAFIHGDWSLDNSGGSHICGVNDELTILRECGCYADFTFPCHYPSQPKRINTIYYASGDGAKPKSYDEGYEIGVNEATSDKNIMMIQGMLGIRFVKRIKSMCLAIEDADISNSNAPTKRRIDYWVKNGLTIKGKPNMRFIKLHTHGAWEGCMDSLLSDGADYMYSYLESKYNDGEKYRLHYVTAREMYNVIKAIEFGIQDITKEHRDFIIKRPEYRL